MIKGEENVDYQELRARNEKRPSAADRRKGSPKVIGWVHYGSVPREGIGRIGGWGGFIESGDRWKDYIAAGPEEHVPFYESLRREILRKGLKRAGDWHQSDPKGVPVFDHGTVGMFTFRAWGDLMAAVWAEHEDRDYSYMDFYMECCISRE